jgi:ArsR family transcriptional regulator
MRVQQVNLMFRAFSDRTRLRVLHVLARQGEVCVGDLVTALRIAQPMASRHLATLRRAGLVSVRREGLWKHYSLAAASSSFHKILVSCLSGCFREVPELAADVKRLERLRKKRSCCPAE